MPSDKNPKIREGCGGGGGVGRGHSADFLVGVCCCYCSVCFFCNLFIHSLFFLSFFVFFFLDNSLLVQPFCTTAQYGSSRVKPIMIEKLAGISSRYC